jgi:hypothetical protein
LEAEQQHRDRNESEQMKNMIVKMKEMKLEADIKHDTLKRRITEFQ